MKKRSKNSYIREKNNALMEIDELRKDIIQCYKWIRTNNIKIKKLKKTINQINRKLKK